MQAATIRGTIRWLLLGIFAVALVVGVGGFYILMYDQQLRQSEQEARQMMASADAVSAYTESQILPLLGRLPESEFHQEAVPFFASQAVFRLAPGKAKLYTFRSPAIDPTNPGDRPEPFDVETLHRFRDQPGLAELTGVRSTAAGQLFWLARPVRLTDPACLDCHSVPARAPAAMVAKYGTGGGFGWQLGDTVAIQMLTVPLTDQLRGLLQLVVVLAGGLFVIFTIAYVVVVAALDTLLIHPLGELARAADAASRSAAADRPLPAGGAREIAQLAAAIGRLRTSLVKALAELAAAGKAERGGGAP